MDKERELKLEYEKSQDSAEHYNVMVWTLTSLIFAFSLLIIRTILLDINSAGWTFSSVGKFTVINGLLLIGTLSWIYFGYLIENADEKKKWKYFICQEIEKRNKDLLGQNLGTKELPFSKKKLGSTFFIIIKNLFIMGFLGLSCLVFYKSINTNEIMGAGIILMAQIITFIVYYSIQIVYITINKTINFDEILQKLKKR